MDDAGDGIVVITLDETVDETVVEPVRRQARELLRAVGVTTLVADMAGVTFVDSVGLGLLVQLRELAIDRGATFVLRSVPPKVNQLLHLTGLLNVFPAQ